MLVSPENMVENRIFKNVTLNFSTVNRNKDNIVFIMGKNYEDYKKVFAAKLFKPMQLYCAYAPRIVRPLNRKTVRLDQSLIYDNIFEATNNFIKVGKIMPNAYANRNLLYDIIPEYNATFNLVNETFSGTPIRIHPAMMTLISNLISTKPDDLGYSKAYIVVPITEGHTNVKQLVKLRTYKVFDPAIELIKMLGPDGSASLNTFDKISRIIFINPDAKAAFAIDPRNPELKDNFQSVLLKIIRLYGYNSGEDSLSDIEEVNFDEMNTPTDEKQMQSKINDEVESKEEVIINHVLNKIGTTLKTKNKLQDYTAATIEEKGIINTISKKVDSYLRDPANADKSFDEMVDEVQKDKDVVSSAVAYIDNKVAANKNLTQLAKNLKTENKIVDSILDLEDEVNTIIEPDKLIDDKKSDGLSDAIKSSSLNTLNKVYEEKQAKKDIMSTLTSFSDPDQYTPLTLNNLQMEDTSDEFNEKKTYHVQYKTPDNKTVSFKLDVPKVIDNNYLYIGGNKYIIGKQLIRLPIVKTKKDRVEIVTSLNKITIERTSGKISRKNQILFRLLKDMSRFPNIKVIYGDNSINNSNYKNDFEYEELASNITAITSPKYSLLFNRHKLDKLINTSDYDIDRINKDFTPLGFSMNDDLVGIYNYKVYTLDENYRMHQVSESLFQFIVKEVLNYDQPIANTNVTSYVFSTAKFMEAKMPVFVLCGIILGIRSILKREHINWKIADKKQPFDEHFVEVRFADCYFYYENTMQNTMLLNCLNGMNTQQYDFSDFDTADPFVDYLVTVCGQPKQVKNMLYINLSKMMDPVSVEILHSLKLPTNIFDLLLLSSKMLIDNAFTPDSDVSNFRIRGNEIIPALMYKIIADAYRKYENARLNGSKVNFNIGQKDLINDILSQQNINPASVLNPLLEIESIANCTHKGLRGINIDQAYKPELRAYDRSMEGYLSANATAYSGQVGISRSLSYNPQVKNIRGYLPRIDDSEITGANILSASEMMAFGSAAHNDSPRIAMEVGQQKHLMPVKKMNRQLVGYGVNKTIGKLLGDEFVFKAKKDGIVDSIDESKKLVLLKYVDGSWDAIDTKDILSKNSNSGFYISQKYLLAFKVGDKFKAGDIIAYNSSFFEKNKATGNDVEFLPGTLAWVAITANDGAFEDSCLISEKLSEECASYVTKVKTVSLGKNTVIKNIVSEGTHVSPNDTLMSFMESFKDKATVEFLKNLGSDVEELATTDITTKEEGEVTAIEYYYNCPFEELDESVQKIISDYEKENNNRISELRNKGISAANIKIHNPNAKGIRKIQGAEFDPDGGIIICFYIKHEDKMRTGDKLSFSVANKGVVSTVYNRNDVRTADGKEIDAICTPTGVISRLTYSIYLQLYYNKILVELGKQIHEIATKG